jgi:hypothetical protein
LNLLLNTHFVAVNDLPPLHKDPFDRMLVAQARVDGLLLLTVDKALAKYGEGMKRSNSLFWIDARHDFAQSSPTALTG